MPRPAPLASVLKQEYQCEPSGGCVSEPSTTTLQYRSLCWTWKSSAAPPKRNWIGSRKTDVTAHRQETCATTQRRFAYVDSKGRRRLPIHDEAHVRNALARFN